MKKETRKIIIIKHRVMFP